MRRLFSPAGPGPRTSDNYPDAAGRTLLLPSDCLLCLLAFARSAGAIRCFWATVRTALKSQGRAFFVDSLLQQASTAGDHNPLDESGILQRRLNDGREFDIVKVFYEPAVLERRLSERGWHGWVRTSGKFFLYGSVTPVERPQSGGER